MKILIEFLFAAILIVGLTTMLTWAYDTMQNINKKNSKKRTKKGL